MWALAVAAERWSRPTGLAVRGGAELANRSFCVGRRRVHVRVGGPANSLAVVLVHGVIVSSCYLMPLAVELADDRPVLVPDLPGYASANRRQDD